MGSAWSGSDSGEHQYFATSLDLAENTKVNQWGSIDFF
jgi:hypothetical protein